jgi:cytochrome c oxidase subunit 2
MREGRVVFLGAANALVALVPMVGCGDDDSDGLSGGDPADADVTVVALDTLDFDQDDYTVPAGEVTFAYEHGGTITHTLVIEGVDDDDFKLKVDSSGDVDTGTVELEAGEYRIYCDVPGHEEMEATLTVE